MKPIGIYLYTALGWLVCTIAFVLHFILMLIVGPFVKHRVGFNISTARAILAAGFRIMGITLTVIDADHIPTSGPFIIIANHQSHLDIAAFLIATRRPYSFVAKQELLKVPLLGWELRSQGHIAIDRSKPTRAKAQLDSLIDDIRNGKRNLLVFAEGTRSATGALGKFKLGAFDLAAKSGATVVPASIVGSGAILRKNSLKLTPGGITIRFGTPFTIPADATGTVGGLDPFRDAVVRDIRHHIDL